MCFRMDGQYFSCRQPSKRRQISLLVLLSPAGSISRFYLCANVKTREGDIGINVLASTHSNSQLIHSEGPYDSSTSQTVPRSTSPTINSSEWPNLYVSIIRQSTIRRCNKFRASVRTARLSRVRVRFRVRHCRTIDMSDYCNVGLLPHHSKLFLSDSWDVGLFLSDYWHVVLLKHRTTYM